MVIIIVIPRYSYKSINIYKHHYSHVSPSEFSNMFFSDGAFAFSFGLEKWQLL
jgi:hypothetical protein